MNSIVAVEDFLKEKIEAMVPNGITVGTLPSALNLALLRRLINAGNGIYITFLGGPITDNGAAYMDGKFDVYIIVRHVGDEEARRRGDTTVTGVYHLLDQVIKQFHGKTVPEVGTLIAKNAKNLFTIQIEEQFKAALYAITFEVPNMPFAFEADTDGMADFITLFTQYDIPPHEADGEREQWLQEPPDHADSEPELQDNLTNLNQ